MSWIMVGRVGNAFCVPLAAITEVRITDRKLTVGAGKDEYFIEFKTEQGAFDEMMKICARLPEMKESSTN